ncbi:serine hydrolase domain-containing protein [Streptomyces sp. NPDC048282]|uniref:serine hydrolase domain-containing protein n=1 Tax=Streptomyces sp. NPDC048282 TaxID=3365528 RepID=UPI0037183D46
MADIHGSYDGLFSAVPTLLSALLDEGDAGGAVAVFVDGEPVVDVWGGFVDAGRSVPWERDTLVGVYSVTKTMTALCALVLVDRGELDPEAPVSRYWPEFAEAGKERVLVRHLLAHTAGLPDWEGPVAELYDWAAATARLAGQAPRWEPGTAAGYHSLTQGFLVGEVVRRITGRGLGEFFAAEVAGPLGADFHIGLGAEHDGRVALTVPPPGKDENYAAGAASREAADAASGEAADTANSEAADTANSEAADTANSEAADAASGEAADAASGEAADAASGEAADEKDTGAPARTATTLRLRDGNSLAWRRAQIPAASGYGNARSVALVQSLLACGGTVGGVRVLSPEGCARAREVQFEGEDRVLGMPARYGLGYGLFGNALGWGGWGGALVWVDPEERMTLAYVTNQMREPAADNRGVELVMAAQDGLKGLHA